jgi:hypothetical protein
VSGSLDDRCQKYENIDRRCDHFFCLALPAFARNLPDKSFFNGNDVYQWCQTDKTLAQGYVVGVYDMAAHAAYSIDGMRHFGAMPNSDAEVELALDRVADFYKPEHATVEQMTDVFCAHLKDKPAERHGLPSTIFNEALKQAWPCPGGK